MIASTIEDLGGDPIDEPEFDFGAATEDPDEFLNVLTGEIGFPNAFDEALTIEEVNERTGPFFA